jgi:carboxyl-terminal processing protease
MSINQFNWQSRKQFKEDMDYFGDKNCSKYIFDVRNNPGGVLDDVSYMLNYFVPEKETIVLMKYKDSESKIIANDRIDKLTNEDVIVLVNG